MELGYLTPTGNLVTVDTLGWRTLFRGISFDTRTSTLHHLTRTLPLERISTIRIGVRLHRNDWRKRGEIALRSTTATWYSGKEVDLFVGPTAWSIRVPWRGELRKVHRPFFALEEPIKGALEFSVGYRSTPCVVYIERAAVRGYRRSGRVVEIYDVERKEFSDFILGRLAARVEFQSEADAIRFTDGLPAGESLDRLNRDVTPDITRSKRIVWTPLVAAVAAGGVLFLGFVIAGTVVGFLEGKYAEAEQATLGIASGLAVVSWALPLLLRTRRKEFLDLTSKWPRVLCERWGKEYSVQSARASHALQSMGVHVRGKGGGLVSLDALLRSLPPDTFYGTFALQVALLVTERLVGLVGRDFPYSWEYLPDRRECAFRIDAAGLRLYPLTAVMAVWQMKDPEGLDPFVRGYAREIQLRLAFRDSLPAFVALGFAAQGWEAFSKFCSRLDGELVRARKSVHAMGERTIAETILRYGPINLVLVEEEMHDAEGPRFVPLFGFPFLALPATASLKVERANIGADQVAEVSVGAGRRLTAGIASASLLLGGEPGQAEPFEICGILERAQVLAGPGLGPETELAPPSPASKAKETSLGPTAIRARVVDTSHDVNRFNGSPIWCLTLDLEGLVCPVAARGDAWTEPPAIGQVLLGSVWFFVRPAGSRLSQE